MILDQRSIVAFITAPRNTFERNQGPPIVFSSWVGDILWCPVTEKAFIESLGSVSNPETSWSIPGKSLLNRTKRLLPPFHRRTWQYPPSRSVWRSPQARDAISATRRPVPRAISRTIHSRTELGFSQHRRFALARTISRRASTSAKFRYRGPIRWRRPTAALPPRSSKEFIYQFVVQPVYKLCGGQRRTISVLGQAHRGSWGVETGLTRLDRDLYCTISSRFG